MATARNQTFGSMSPRQKMINLMYIVLTAMLALNVSSDVLNGFKQVADGLERSNRTLTARNNVLYAQLVEFNNTNPAKGKSWLDKGNAVRKQTADLYAYIDTLKLRIVQEADGPDGKVDDIRNTDNLDAAAHVMLPPTGKQGRLLRERINSYRNFVLNYIDDPQKRANLQTALATNPVKSADNKGTLKNWEESMFENMPTIAAVTLLSKLQNDIRYAEGEVLNHIISNLDAGDLRVNLINAFVVPDSRIVMRGTKYSANIVMAAIDTTQRPVVYVNGQRINNDRGLYQVGAGKAGNYEYSGYIEVMNGNGELTRRPFKSSYTVIDPLATVSATMMNVFYAGINNPVSIAVPGVPATSIQATMTNGSLTKSGNGWIARPTRVGAECKITVTAEFDGTRTNVGSTTFKVRKLPDPLPYIAYRDANGNENRYKGGRAFSKTLLLAAQGVDAAIDDDLLNIDYRVVRFETIFFDSMGNAIPEVSNGSHFSDRQRTAIRRLQRGKRFYIRGVKATGPDGITRDIAPMEVIVN